MYGAIIRDGLLHNTHTTKYPGGGGASFLSLEGYQLQIFESGEIQLLALPAG